MHLLVNLQTDPMSFLMELCFWSLLLESDLLIQPTHSWMTAWSIGLVSSWYPFFYCDIGIGYLTKLLKCFEPWKFYFWAICVCYVLNSWNVSFLWQIVEVLISNVQLYVALLSLLLVFKASSLFYSFYESFGFMFLILLSHDLHYLLLSFSWLLSCFVYHVVASVLYHWTCLCQALFCLSCRRIFGNQF